MRRSDFPFAKSLSALAAVALRETGAAGYGLFERTADQPGLRLLEGLGVEITAQAVLQAEEWSLIVLPLGEDGLAAFSFRDAGASVHAEAALDGFVEALNTIWAAREIDTHYLSLLGRLSTLEAQLIDSKIADRAQGLLNTEQSADVLDALVRHVKTVLRPSSAGRTIETMVKELEDEIEERHVTGKAKAILQAAHAMSEEQAYAQLRLRSRKSRRRLKEVALDVIAGDALKSTAA